MVSSRGGRKAERSRSSSALETIVQAMEAGQARDAVDALSRLEASVRQKGKADGVRLSRIWEAFRLLLHRRGYFVSAPEQIADSLKEIHEVGQGFDLHDLAVTIARFDMEITQCLKLLPERLFPELHAFAPRCDCWKRPFEAR